MTSVHEQTKSCRREVHGILTFVPEVIPMPTVKTAISLDRDLLERIDALAEELDQPRSRVLAMAAEELLRRRESRELLERLNRAHGPEGGGIAHKDLRRRKHRDLVQGEW